MSNRRRIVIDVSPEGEVLGTQPLPTPDPTVDPPIPSPGFVRKAARLGAQAGAVNRGPRGGALGGAVGAALGALADHVLTRPQVQPVARAARTIFGAIQEVRGVLDEIRKGGG
jgi:hypothetical protein